ncbi:hypothetical protein ROA7023_02881 [Roseisalinus antarcticus]|uniref:Uncharacterized protein n=1 Tax=Roseisalinus antarcticus TaxID=254357 RepID=A0A1Y5TGV7_9RHOB|nr:hypothetical protein ROA7023_02881 [Roseisalinus antarcticus]
MQSPGAGPAPKLKGCRNVSKFGTLSRSRSGLSRHPADPLPSTYRAGPRACRREIVHPPSNPPASGSREAAAFRKASMKPMPPPGWSRTWNDRTPPGFRTRCISTRPARRSGTRFRTRADVTMSTLSSSGGRVWAVAVSKRTLGPVTVLRAWATKSSDASVARIELGACPCRMAEVRAPDPQTISSQSAACFGASQSRNSLAINRLHRPLSCSWLCPARLESRSECVGIVETPPSEQVRGAKNRGAVCRTTPLVRRQVRVGRGRRLRTGRCMGRLRRSSVTGRIGSADRLTAGRVDGTRRFDGPFNGAR